jgi:acetyl esterase/lipase
VASAFVAAGAASTPTGKTGTGLFLLSELGLLVVIARSIRSARATGHSPSVLSLPIVKQTIPASVTEERNIHYWDGLTLDIYRQATARPGPALIYVHPGSWMRGRPGRQARPMLHQLASSGWTVLDIRYPLSPAATFPDHLVGVNRAIAWAKSDGIKYGVDPNLVAISGGSSGAHLAALAALTWDNPALQPGFERADTSVIACVPFYGIYDLLVRNPTRYDWPFIARHVLKASKHDAPELYRLGSPLDQVRRDAPPFLVIHGEFDSVVLPDDSRQFVAAMRTAGAEVEYREIGGAQHGFDAIASLRTRAVGAMAAEWLKMVADRQQGDPPVRNTANRTESEPAPDHRLSSDSERLSE